MKYMRGGAVSPDDVTDEDGRMAQVGARRASMGECRPDRGVHALMAHANAHWSYIGVVYASKRKDDVLL